MKNHIMTRSLSCAAPVRAGAMRRLVLAFGLLSAGCNFGDTLQPYYKGAPPEVSGLSSQVEEGNIGGGTVRISGSGFGSDPNVVTVVFGSQNARVVSASDSELEVVVPRGPIEGGFVDVVVGTATGQMRVEDGYQYDTRMGADVDIFENQVAYIAVTNDYFSCGGGIGNILAYPALLELYGWEARAAREIENTGEIKWTHEEDGGRYSPYETFCNEGLTFGGYVGIEGRAEMLEFPYPRIHTLFAGYRNGFGGNFDLSPNEWSVQVPSQDVVSIDIENFYDDLRTEINDFVITNVDVMDAKSSEEREYCADLSALVDVEFDPGPDARDEAGCKYNSFSTNGPFYLEHPTCEGNAARKYDLAEMQFCQFDDYENTRSFRYEAEWPVGEYFFKGANPAVDEDSDADELALFEPTTIQLDVPEAGIAGVQVELPEAAVFLGDTGWNTSYFSPSANTQTKGIYGLLGFQDTCADSDNDGETTSADIAATVTWRPSQVDLTEGDGITGARTFVRFTVTAAGFGWYGGEGAVMKATITVDDFHNTDFGDEDDPYDDVSTLEIPASVLYQVPSMVQNFGGLNVPDNAGSDLYDECGEFAPGADIQFEWAKSDVVNYGFVITQVERVTEYAVEAPDLGGDLVFAYSSGDIGYTVFGTASDGSASWLNPVDGSSTCGDCSDSDDDGWADAEDPDCMAPDVDGDGVADIDINSLQEDGSRFGEFSCNDGIDNDDDGNIDSDDNNCRAATDSESNCFDEQDNDGDNWIDAEDPDCWMGGVGYESGLSDFQCNDGIDNDNDGRIDNNNRNGEDECTSADQREINCNDGIDNDEDGLVDDADPECQDENDLVEDFFHDTDTSCNDGIDNDGDGWIDLDDLDCASATDEESGFTDFECNNGVDDDGQGDVDGLDPSCVRDGPSGLESPVFTAGCADGSDNDGDGYTDGNDPDCEFAPFSIERNQFHDPSFYDGVPACYNGIDDDDDGAVDALDADCVNDAGEPSGFARAEDPTRPECTNGQDDDSDGWTDGADPDCSTGDTEDGLGAGECNDGEDNDGDTLVDAEDPDCDTAAGTESD